MKYFGILFFIIGMTQCKSTKITPEKAFEIESASYENWVGGQPGVGGTNVKILLKTKVDVQFDSLFFGKNSSKIEIKEQNNKTLLIVNFSYANPPNYDLILDIDPRKELKNPIPKTTKNNFQLKENQAMIRYFIDGKQYYFKVTNLQKLQDKFYQ